MATSLGRPPNEYRDYHPHQYDYQTCKVGQNCDVAIHSGMAAQQLDWSGKNADFSTLVGCHGNVP